MNQTYAPQAATQPDEPTCPQAYSTPRLRCWGDFASLTRGSTGGTSDGNMTGVSETFQFVPAGDWRLDDDC